MKSYILSFSFFLSIGLCIAQTPITTDNVSQNAFYDDEEQPTNKATTSTSYMQPRTIKYGSAMPSQPNASIATTTTISASEEDDEVLIVVENKPEFPGGDAALMKYIAENIKYPVIAQKSGIQGRVICQYVVNKDGSVTDVAVVRSVDPSLDQEAMRVIKLMPQWIPGRQRGKAVRVKYTLPIVFRLQ